MNHKTVKRIIAQANTGIVFIHGILGTPNHFRDFLELIGDDVSVYNVLLDGHGEGVKAFSKTSMTAWENQIQGIVDELSATHKQLYIVAHSMGTLLAIEQAIKNPKVTKLFLLAAPLKLSLKPQLVSNSLKVYFDKIRPDDLPALAAKNCCGIRHSKNVFLYLGWIPRFLELFAKIRRTRKALHTLTTPSLVFQSAKDEMVSVKSVRLLQKNPAVSVVMLKHSGHFYYESEDFSLLTDTFQKWLFS